MGQIKICKQLLIFGIASSMFFSCIGTTDDDNVQVNIDTYVNQTDHMIKIDHWFEKYRRSWLIKKGGSLEVRKVLPSLSGCNYTVSGSTKEISETRCFLMFSDSVKITFDNEKFLFFKQGSKSPLSILTNEDNYTVLRGDRHYRHIRYTFTKKDYDNAEDCNGKCAKYEKCPE